MSKKTYIHFIPKFVKSGTRAEAYFNKINHNTEISGAQNEIYFSKKNVKAPQGWSPTAIDIAASKYFRKNVKDENSIFLLIERIGLGLEAAIKSSRLFETPQLQKQYLEEIKYILLSQKAAFNSPVWFNLGLKQAYGLSSKSEHFYFDVKNNKIKKTNDAYLHPQSSACFIQSIQDSLESIFDLVKSEAKLFKYGSGSGTNFSTLRAKNELLFSGGHSSGLISFLEVLDKAAGAIKSGGTTRRAAKMVCVDIDHPEIEDFINWKVKEEKKAQVLINSGYSPDLDGETYKSISGQNANNSIRIPNQFMQSIGLNKTWKLKNRINKKTFKTVEADQLWMQICEAAWECADPGLQFDDTINAYNTCSSSGKINASNPCSEFMFLDDTACNLASLNLVKFLDENLEFKLDDFIHAIKCIFIAQESLVDFSSYPTEKIATNSHQFRPLGLGFANLGSFCMRLGLSYDSEQARAWAAFLSALMTGVAYETSAEMAKAKGAFAGYKKNKTSMLKVIKKHKNSLTKIDWQYLPSGYKKISQQIWQQVQIKGQRYGFRNAQATAIAPTGTIGLVMDCDTTGIEPDFSLIKNKKLSGGGYLKIVNQSVSVALKKLNYSEIEITKILKQISENSSVVKTDIKLEHQKIFSCATGDLALSPEAHLKMMAAVQPFISGAISKTVNLPESATVEDISETYKKAWQMNLKSIAIYRDNSKFIQPLTSHKKPILQSSEQNKDQNKDQGKVQNNTKKFPHCTECGFETVLESGCYRCTNCGTTTACSS